ncbi:MAG: tryptophan 7-halogenase [Halobacteriales archaeon]|nr:tryptophan 7-halogenase [Halobacteriales archaeon]
MENNISSVTIVGGGDAGLLTALALRSVNPDLRIRVVDDFEESPTTVGKSTYRAIVPLLHDVLDIDEGRFLEAVKPVWKGSVYFEDWCGYDPFHYAFDDRSVKPDIGDPHSGQSLYHYYEDRDRTTPGEAIVEHGKTPLTYSPNEDYVAYPHVAYHLSLGRFNNFLRTLCEERNVALVDDRITAVETNADQTWIEQIESDTATYQSDLFVDVTGFDRLLIGELDSSFRSFDIPLDSAIHAIGERSLEEIEPATVVETGDYGWFWQIDTFDARDMGYVFASDYVSEEQALAEFEAHRDEVFLETEVYHFDSGFYEDAWVGNCLANGNALGFIEPLQSTALTTHGQTAIWLSRLLASHCRINNEGIRESFNGYVRGVWNSIYDFISVHYAFADGDTDFWADIQSIPLSEKVERYIDYYDKNGFELHDAELVDEAGHDLDLLTFPTSSLYRIMMLMGATSSFYENHDIEVPDEVKERWRQRNAAARAMAEECLSYEEVYNSGLIDSYTHNEQEFTRMGFSRVGGL